MSTASAPVERTLAFEEGCRCRTIMATIITSRREHLATSAHLGRRHGCRAGICPDRRRHRRRQSRVGGRRPAQPQRRRLARAGAVRAQDRKSVVWGKRWSVRVDLGGPRVIKKKNKI